MSYIHLSISRVLYFYSQLNFIEVLNVGNGNAIISRYILSSVVNSTKCYTNFFINFNSGNITFQVFYQWIIFSGLRNHNLKTLKSFHVIAVPNISLSCFECYNNSVIVHLLKTCYGTLFFARFFMVKF